MPGAPHDPAAQVRPSTGTPDLKESFQIGYTAAAAASWPDAAALPGFRPACERFMARAAAVSDVLLRALALALEMPEEALLREHDPHAPDVQTVLCVPASRLSWLAYVMLMTCERYRRLLHYPALEACATMDDGERWRAGAHTDFDVLTLLFQRPGEGGLEVCPGRVASTEFAHGDTWLPVPPTPGCITCNLGDMLMRWCDDGAKSTFHRVRAPPRSSPEAAKPRYSIAYFNQASESTVIQGPLGKYPPLTGREFLVQSIERNFAALRARKAAEAA